MKQIFYTQEGTPYVIRSVTNNLINTVIPFPTTVPLRIFINLTGGGSISTIDMKTSKRIVPIMAGLSIVNSGGIAIDITSVYCSADRSNSGTVPSVDAQKGQLKLWPFVDQIYLTNSNLYAFNVRYNQATFNDSDFLDPTSGITLTFLPSRAEALTNQNLPISIPSIQAGTYNSNVNFIYAEML